MLDCAAAAIADNTARNSHAVKGLVETTARAGQPGTVAGEDGRLYIYTQFDWLEHEPARIGDRVDFMPSAEHARDIHSAPPEIVDPDDPESAQMPGSERTEPLRKSRAATIVLALLLGSLGAHKFYLGYPVPGLVLLVGTAISVPLWIATIGFFGTASIVAVTVIEAVIYATMPSDQFHGRYVVGRRSWF